MDCYCRDEFDWFINMIKGDCFCSFKDSSDFIDNGLLQLRHMRKRFGYLFYSSIKFIVCLLMSRTKTNRRTDREQYTKSNAATARLLTLVKPAET